MIGIIDSTLPNLTTTVQSLNAAIAFDSSRILCYFRNNPSISETLNRKFDIFETYINTYGVNSINYTDSTQFRMVFNVNGTATIYINGTLVGSFTFNFPSSYRLYIRFADNVMSRFNNISFTPAAGGGSRSTPKKTKPNAKSRKPHAKSRK
jgi:hypothetical protein